MKSITLTEIADKAGVSVTFIHFLVTGKKRPSWKRAKQIAKITGTDPILWLDGSPEEIQAAAGIKTRETV